MSEHELVLPDGRRLAYMIYGPAEGRSVLYFHGTPSSRLEPQLLRSYGQDPEAILQAAGLRLITFDRPGMGGSDPDPQGDFLSVAADAHHLLRHLRVERCGLLCWSGGGPYALAFAHRYPARVATVHILCGFTRQLDAGVLQDMNLSRWYFRLARYTPGLLRGAMNLLKKQKRHGALPQALTGLPDVDYQFLRTDTLMDSMSRCTFREACRKDARGPVTDAVRYFNPLGFSLAQLQPEVHYWWGTQDGNVVGLHAEAVQQVPHYILHRFEGEGHLSLYVRCFGQALQQLSHTLNLPIWS